MSGRYLKCWFNNSYCHLFFCSFWCMWGIAILLNVAILSIFHAYDNGNFFWTSMPKIISVSGNLSQTMKKCVNLKSSILRWSAIIPNAVVGNPSAVFNVVVVASKGCFKTVIYELICRVSNKQYCCPWVNESLIIFSGMDYYCWTVCDECFGDRILCS